MDEQTEIMSDADREAAIASVFAQMQAPSCTRSERQILFSRFKALVAGRSAEQVARMEQERGLAPKAA